MSRQRSYEGTLNALVHAMHPDDDGAKRGASGYEWIVVAVDRKPAALERRVAATLDRQLQSGLFDEVRALDERYALAEEFARRGPAASNQVLHTHGYREFFEHARSQGRPVAQLTKTDLAAVRDAALEHIVAYTRRQRSWFKKIDHVRPPRRSRLCRMDREPAPSVSASAWVAWHDRYDDPDSALSHRLAVVRRRIGEALDGALPGPITVVSMCAGQGRDLLGALDAHPRRDDVRARLVELDEDNVAFARASARAAGLDEANVEIVRGDASDTTRTRAWCPPTWCSCAASSATFPTTTSGTRSCRSPRSAHPVPRWSGRVGGTRPTSRRPSGAGSPMRASTRWRSTSRRVSNSASGTHRYTGDAKPFVPGVHLFTFV